MFLPGMLIFVFMTLVTGNKLSVDEYRAEKFISWTVFFLVSYLLGIVNHVATSVLVGLLKFRNNPSMISRAFECVHDSLPQNRRLSAIEDDVKVTNLRPCNVCLLLAILSVVLSVIIVIIPFNDKQEYQQCLHRQYLMVIPLLLIYSVTFLCVCIPCRRKCRKTNLEHKVLEHYYKAYYYVAKNKYSDDVFIMEGQVAFMQSMIIPLILYLFVPKCELECLLCLNACLVKMVLSVFIVIMLVVINLRQMKIYQRVWEDYAYLKGRNRV